MKVIVCIVAGSVVGAVCSLAQDAPPPAPGAAPAQEVAKDKPSAPTSDSKPQVPAAPLPKPVPQSNARLPGVWHQFLFKQEWQETRLEFQADGTVKRVTAVRQLGEKWPKETIVPGVWEVNGNKLKLTFEGASATPATEFEVIGRTLLVHQEDPKKAPFEYRRLLEEALRPAQQSVAEVEKLLDAGIKITGQVEFEAIESMSLRQGPKAAVARVTLEVKNDSPVDVQYGHEFVLATWGLERWSMSAGHVRHRGNAPERRLARASANPAQSYGILSFDDPSSAIIVKIGDQIRGAAPRTKDVPEQAGFGGVRAGTTEVFFERILSFDSVAEALRRAVLLVLPAITVHARDGDVVRRPLVTMQRESMDAGHSKWSVQRVELLDTKTETLSAQIVNPDATLARRIILLNWLMQVSGPGADPIADLWPRVKDDRGKRALLNVAREYQVNGITDDVALLRKDRTADADLRASASRFLSAIKKLSPDEPAEAAQLVSTIEGAIPHGPTTTNARWLAFRIDAGKEVKLVGLEAMIQFAALGGSAPKRTPHLFLTLHDDEKDSPGKQLIEWRFVSVDEQDKSFQLRKFAGECKLEAGKKYWIVAQSDNGSTDKENIVAWWGSVDASARLGPWNYSEDHGKTWKKEEVFSALSPALRLVIAP